MEILVVDDEPAVRDALDRALKLEGYEVALAPAAMRHWNGLPVAASMR
jgi:DNA-binding response OmpR family regulator